MTKVIARIPATIEFDLPSKAETHPGRVAEIHGLLKDGLINASLEAATPAGKTVMTVRGLDHSALSASWDNDADNPGVTTWNSYGQQLDTRLYETSQNTGDENLIDLKFSPDGVAFKTVAVVTHPAIADAIGKAWQDGDINFNPRLAFV